MKIGDIVNFQNGYAFKSKEFISNGDYKVIKIKELKDGKVKFFNDSASINIENIQNYEKYIVKKDDILFALTGDPVNKNNPLSWVGRVSIYEYDIPALLNQRVCKLNPNKNVNPKYIYYFFRNFENIYALASIAKGSASQANLSTKDIENVEIFLPSLDIQNKVVDILDCISNKINENIKINKNLEQQAQALYQSWFINYEPFDNCRPSDWKNGIIDDLAKQIICGKTPPTKKKEYYDGDIPFITIPDMHNCVYNVITNRYLSTAGVASQIKKTLPKNSVCVSCIGTAGLVTLASENSQTNQQINSIIPKENISPYFIYLLMNTLSETINKLGQSGSTIVNLNKTQFGKINIVIPTKKVLKDFNSVCSPLFEMILSNQKENIKLIYLKDTLLPKLMSSEIDVSNLDI